VRLEKMGSSCYFNAVLQCMSANDECCGSAVRSRSGAAGQNSTTTAAESNSSSLVLELLSVLAVLAGDRFIATAAAVMQPRALPTQRAAAKGRIRPIIIQPGITHVPLHHMCLAFAFLSACIICQQREWNCRGLGFRCPVIVRGARALSLCSFVKIHTNMRFIFLRRLQINATRRGLGKKGAL
jgi:hypothetical protein